MKQLLFALFIVLAYSTATGGSKRKAATIPVLMEMINDVEHLQGIGKVNFSMISVLMSMINVAQIRD